MARFKSLPNTVRRDFFVNRALTSPVLCVDEHAITPERELHRNRVRQAN
jgi:hypothetical protein